MNPGTNTDDLLNNLIRRARTTPAHFLVLMQRVRHMVAAELGGYGLQGPNQRPTVTDLQREVLAVVRPVIARRLKDKRFDGTALKTLVRHEAGKVKRKFDSFTAARHLLLDASTQAMNRVLAEIPLEMFERVADNPPLPDGVDDETEQT